MLITSSRRRRALSVLTASMAVLAASLLTGPSARADDANTLTVVGTSDVFDSHLVQDVIKPRFEAAYPQYTLDYVSQGTGAAIAYAKAGSASAMIVHAASLENGFVGDGYSTEQYGRAIFWGDYVLLGPANDPAGVLTTSSHDIATAFEKIATAGAAGTANFVSRGGTPGTTVQEHAIWALTNGVGKCDVSTTNGGGQSPSTTTGSCANPISYPSWYRVTGATQGPNILNADVCNYSPAQGECYTLTDRGTFNYLQATNQIQNLKIVTRDNATSARGGQALLVNSFHAYGVNPAKFTGNSNVQLNPTAAGRFLTWITSPAAQTAIGKYLNGAADPPFLPSAAPAVTSTSLPRTVAVGRPISVSGTVSNVVPGTPKLSSAVVRLKAVRASSLANVPVTVATARTDSAGRYVLRYTPSVNMAYYVTTDAISKVEVSTLSPVFGDLLNASSKALGGVGVQSTIRVARATHRGHSVRLRGSVGPRAAGSGARLVVYAAKGRRPLAYKTIRVLPAGTSTFSTKLRFPRGTWRYQVRYVNARVVDSATTGVRTVRIR